MKPAEVSTPSDREVLVKRSFDAPVNLVWQAYTDPALMRRWLTAMPGWSMPVSLPVTRSSKRTPNASRRSAPSFNFTIGSSRPLRCLYSPLTAQFA